MTTATGSSMFSDNKLDMQAIKNLKNEPITSKGRNVAFMVVAALLFVMVIMFAVQIITGIFALVLTVVTGVGGFMGLRWLKSMDKLVKQKTKNTKLKWMIEEAEKNSMSQLQNAVLDNAQKYQNSLDALAKINAQLRSLKSKLDSDTSSANYKRMSEVISTIEKAYAQKKITVSKVSKLNEEFKEKVEQHKQMKSFSVAAADIQSLLSSGSDAELDEMLSLAAFDSIEMQFNEAVSSVEMSADMDALESM
jgi:hypothetical protein